MSIGHRAAIDRDLKKLERLFNFRLSVKKVRKLIETFIWMGHIFTFRFKNVARKWSGF